MAISEQANHSATQRVSAATIGNEFVSVVIPCLNEERFIAKTLNNLADQYDPQRYEIIIVDGLSKDRTREIITEFCQRRPDI